MDAGRLLLPYGLRRSPPAGSLVASSTEIEHLLRILSEKKVRRVSGTMPRSSRRCFIEGRGRLRLLLGRYLEAIPAKRPVGRCRRAAMGRSTRRADGREE